VGPLKVVIAEDSVLFREGLAALLDRYGHTVLAQTGTAPELFSRVTNAQEQQPDLVITDVRMPPHHGNDGLTTALKIRHSCPQIPIVVLSQYIADAYARQWLHVQPGAVRPAGIGYLLKERVGDVMEFMHAIETVAAGGIVVDPDVIHSLLGPGRARRNAQLTPREEETLALMARGLTNAEIAENMNLTVAGVAKHVSNVFSSLHLGPETGNRRVLAVLDYLGRN
jgi:DNA-binding NarL/FixJ family response regulator